LIASAIASSKLSIFQSTETPENVICAELRVPFDQRANNACWINNA
jgi:hypothetical protein